VLVKDKLAWVLYYLAGAVFIAVGIWAVFKILGLMLSSPLGPIIATIILITYGLEIWQRRSK
jgi:hypothetical protein